MVPRSTSERQRRLWLLAGAVFLAVTVLMLVPLQSGAMAPAWPHFDKLVHACAWAALAVGAWPALRASWPRSRWVRVAASVCALAFWGVAIELLQGLVPQRSSDPLDAFADIAGACLGALLMAGRESWREAAAKAELDGGAAGDRATLAEEAEP